MASKNLRVLIIGAHPDDPDISCGGLALKYTAADHIVKFLSCTNGDTGHHKIGGIELARRRYNESQASAKIAGIVEYEVLDNHCGELEPTVANRKAIIRIIREFKPDIIITHRPNDYHPDHRCTSQLVQDASYIISVPNMVSLTDITPRFPWIFYMYDKFQKPYPFIADMVVAIDDVIEKKVDMIHCHESQMYEWLPFNKGILDQVPRDEASRRKWLADWRLPFFEKIADQYREKLIEVYGKERGKAVRYAEAYEVCEYGSDISHEKLREAFPFRGIL